MRGVAANVHVDLAVGVAQGDRHVEAIRVGEKVDTAERGPLGGESEACGRVVIAAGDHDGRPRIPQVAQRVLEEKERVAGWRGRVEHVARDEHRIHLVITHRLHQRSQHLAERVCGRVPVEGAADVPIGGVQEPHAPNHIGDR